MSQLQFLNVFITERLTAVAMEISVVLEQNIGEYLEEISRSNEENKRLQSLLDLVFNSDIKLHREGLQLNNDNSKCTNHIVTVSNTY